MCFDFLSVVVLVLGTAVHYEEAGGELRQGSDGGQVVRMVCRVGGGGSVAAVVLEGFHLYPSEIISFHLLPRCLVQKANQRGGPHLLR